MKWSIQQLRKIQKFPFAFSDVIDFSEYAANVDDIIEIKPTIVEGNIYRIDDETYRFCYHISVKLILQCALTLDPVEYNFEKDYDEVYGKSEVEAEKENYFVVEKNTIDLSEVVWTNILIEKPINVTLPNAYEILKERGIVLDDTITLDNDEEILFYSDGMDEEEEK